MTPKYAVIGNPITHSLSPTIHQHFSLQTQIPLTYDKIQGNEVNFEQQVTEFFAQGGRGMNVTLPFKRRAYLLAQNHSPRCQQAGAANTLWMENNQLQADNTDGVGLIRDLQRLLTIQDKSILILGAGGAVRGIIGPLLFYNPKAMLVANRTLAKAKELEAEFPQITCGNLSQLTKPYDLIINATSTSLNNEFIKLPEACYTKNTWCYDLAYKLDADTPFLEYAKSLGCSTADGLGMLIEQAAESFRIWNKKKPETSTLINTRLSLNL